MAKRVDLHAHTNCSDGQLTPTELVELAARKGLAALAVTDHDTIMGLEEALAAGSRLGVEVVPGMEFSTKLENRDVHLICLYPDPGSEALRQALAVIADNREARNRRVIQRLSDAGFPMSWEEVTAGHPGVLTRGNLGQAMVDKGYVSTVKEAIEGYISRGKVGYEPRVCPDTEEAVRIMHAAGASVFLAHFHQIDRKDMAHSIRLARKVIEMGIDGIETRYSEFDAVKQAAAESLAEEYGLLRSGGSDFHGRMKPGLELGDGYGTLEVPYEYLERIRESRQRFF